MRLQKLIEDTKTYAVDLESAIQVFPKPENCHLFFHLDDYLVSSAVSGPSYIMIRRPNYEKRRQES